MSSYDHNASVCRKAQAISDALERGNIGEALRGSHPNVVPVDYGPVSQKKAIQVFVEYFSDPRINRMDVKVLDPENGLVSMTICEMELTIQINSKVRYNQAVISVKITGRDIDKKGTLSQRSASVLLGIIWEEAPVVDRIILAQEAMGI